MATTIQEPQELPTGSITPDNEQNFAMIVYQKNAVGAGVKQLRLADFHSYLNWNSHKVNNVALYTGLKDSTPSEFPDWDSDTDVSNLPTGVYSLRTRIESLAAKVGLNTRPETVTRTINSRVSSLETSVDGPSGLPENGLNYKVSTLESKMSVVEDEISGTGAGQGSSILDRVQNIEDIVGTPSSSGLPTLCANMASNNADITTLKNTVDDPNSGVVANRTDITALQNAVDDPNTGNQALSTKIETINDIVGAPTPGSQLMPLCNEVEQLKSSIVNVYSVQGNCVGAVTQSGQDTQSIYVNSVSSTPKPLTDLENGWVYNIKSSNGYVDITSTRGGAQTTTRYFNGTNIVWIKQAEGTSPGYFDELGANIDVSRVDALEQQVNKLKARYGAVQFNNASDQWDSTELTVPGIYQFSFYFDNTSRMGSFVLPIGTAGIVKTSTMLNLFETHVGFIADNFEINTSTSTLVRKNDSGVNNGRLSWTIIGETTQSL